MTEGMMIVFAAGCLISGIVLISLWEMMRYSFSSGKMKGTIHREISKNEE